jgi:hypothetical protein
MSDRDHADEAQRLYLSWDRETKERFWAKLLGDDYPPFRMDTAWTNDHFVPKFYGSDPYIDGSLFTVPQPPGPPEQGWKAMKRQYGYTIWYRNCRDWWGTSRLGGVGGAIAKVLHIRPAGKLED